MALPVGHGLGPRDDLADVSVEFPADLRHLAANFIDIIRCGGHGLLPVESSAGVLSRVGGVP
jgi:hypothetical protein